LDLLPLDENITFAEYIWIDGSGKKVRSKTKTYYQKIKSLEDLEWWTYDGSSCYQAVTGDSEVWLKPVCYVQDPFRHNCNAILVLCETFIHDKVTPARCNFRFLANKIMEESKEHDPWFGLE
jgi:glutamine synthetase